MKKIGILTYHRAINYGAFLQCYSLITYVQSLFPNYKVEVIDYESVDEYIITIKGILKVHSVSDLLSNIKRYRLFRKDLKCYLPLSKKRCISNNKDALSKTYSDEYDAIIVGSDAVWNGFENNKYNFYLNNIKCKKFSYAASTSGLNLEKVSAERKKEVRLLIEDFLYIGVRELKSENILKQLNINKPLYHNCDPTCFIDLGKVNVKIEEKLQKNGIDIKKPIICLMTDNAKVGQVAKDKFGKTHQIVSLYSVNTYADVILYDLSPMEFSVFFSYVSILFSRFFHGCYLCLKNGTPVIATDEIIEPDHEMSKIEYLFKRLGLDEWYFNIHKIKDEDYYKMMSKAHTLMENDQTGIIRRKLEEECKFRNTFTETIVRELSK